MKEKDGQVRLAVLDTVTAWGTTPHRPSPRWCTRCAPITEARDSEESHQDYRSALALAAIGKPAVEGLRGLLKERKESVRAEVVMALGRIGPDAAAGRPRPDPAARRQERTDPPRSHPGARADRHRRVEPLVAASAHKEVDHSSHGRSRAWVSARRRLTEARCRPSSSARTTRSRRSGRPR